MVYMHTMTSEVRAPAVVNDPLFRSAVREHLVTLGNDSSGLGLMVTGKQNAVVVFPRAGRRLKTFEDFLGLTWKRVTVHEDTGKSPSFEPMRKEDVEDFLKSLTRTQPVTA
jgi:hypothetical protein